MGIVAFSRVRQVVVAFAILLMAVLAVQTPLEQAHLDAEQFLALDAGGAHASASVQTGVAEASLVHLVSVAIETATDPEATEAPASGPHHHHGDGPPVHGLASGAAAPTVSTLTADRFLLENDHRTGLTGNPQDRPPRPALEPTA